MTPKPNQHDLQIERFSMFSLPQEEHFDETRACIYHRC
jgi:hypothetical protein